MNRMERIKELEGAVEVVDFILEDIRMGKYEFFPGDGERTPEWKIWNQKKAEINLKVIRECALEQICEMRIMNEVMRMYEKDSFMKEIEGRERDAAGRKTDFSR